MALEIIEIENAKDQNLVVSYGSRSIIFEIKWNELLNYWYFNIKENGAYIASGLTMVVNTNLLYDKFQLGKLYLIDTLQGQTTAPIVKTDLGTRLALAREYSQ